MHGAVVRVPEERGAGRHAVFEGETLLGVGVVHDGLLEPRTVIAARGAT